MKKNYHQSWCDACKAKNEIDGFGWKNRNHAGESLYSQAGKGEDYQIFYAGSICEALDCEPWDILAVENIENPEK